MRVEIVNNRNLLCGHFLSTNRIQAGQVWAPADGGNYTVSIVEVDGDDVVYEGPVQPRHSKDAFSFQSRYCLVLESTEIPRSLLQ